MVNCGALESITKMLSDFKDDYNEKIVAIDFISAILSTSKGQELSHNTHAVTFQNIGGLDIVEDLQDSPNQDLNKI